jgi:hypothetical protein
MPRRGRSPSSASLTTARPARGGPHAWGETLSNELVALGLDDPPSGSLVRVGSWATTALRTRGCDNGSCGAVTDRPAGDETRGDWRDLPRSPAHAWGSFVAHSVTRPDAARCESRRVERPASCGRWARPGDALSQPAQWSMAPDRIAGGGYPATGDGARSCTSIVGSVLRHRGRTCCPAAANGRPPCGSCPTNRAVVDKPGYLSCPPKARSPCSTSGHLDTQDLDRDHDQPWRSRLG